MKVVVIGGGPAGMIAAINAAENGDEVILLEKNQQLGKKLLITGKGRCNLTSSLDMSEFIQNIPGNGKFLYSAFQEYTNQDIIKLMEHNGVPVKVERGNRVFPVSDKSSDVLKALENELNKKKVQIILNAKVIQIKKIEEKIFQILFQKGQEQNKLSADKIIIATGGATYSSTGSTGDGYSFAKEMGHTITAIKPSLVPLVMKEKDLALCKEMQGLSLKNVSILITDTEKKKRIYEDFGEMLFTHFGVSGPIILSASAHLLRYSEIQSALKKEQLQLFIDLKPALSTEQLENRIQRDFEKNKNKQFKNSLSELLPQKMIEPIIQLSNILPEKEVNSITKEERKKLVSLIKKFTLTISGFRPLDEGIITSGGVNVKEINPKTMESKLVKGLFFAGEVIDVDAYTGGFNLQIAYSTGYLAGAHVEMKKNCK